MENEIQKFTEQQEKHLLGSMLGDGSLWRRKESYNSRLTIRRAAKDVEYLKYEYDLFKDFCSDKSFKETNAYDKRTDKTYYGYTLTTKTNKLLTEVSNKWYIDGKKTVPNDIKLEPESIAIWFADDGSILKTSNTRLRIKFSTNSFSKDEVFFLKTKLDDLYNVKFLLHKHNGEKEQYTIEGHDHQAIELLKSIDKHFPDSMSRKSDVWRSGLVNIYGARTKTKSNNSIMKSKNITECMLNLISFTGADIASNLNMYDPRGNISSSIVTKIKKYTKLGYIKYTTQPKNLNVYSNYDNLTIIDHNAITNEFSKYLEKSKYL